MVHSSTSVLSTTAVPSVPPPTESLLPPTGTSESPSLLCIYHLSIYSIHSVLFRISLDIHSSCCDSVTIGGISGAWNYTNVLAVEETTEDTHML